MSYQINTKEEFENFVVENWNNINLCIDKAQAKHPIPLTSSVDIRESKTKFAPVDHNLYPAGFNNLCHLDLKNASRVFQKTIFGISPQIEKIGILAESHTKNLFYLDHLATLKNCLEDAGYDLALISFDEGLFQEGEKLDLTSHSGHQLSYHRASLKEGRVQYAGTVVDLVVMNNDQSNPLDLPWSDIQTPIHPSPLVGWFQRDKVRHFCHYQKVVSTFCEEFSINPDLLQAKYRSVDNINFATKDGIDSLADEAEKLFSELPEGKKVFIKGSKGTYGMGISVVSSAEEIRSMNRKTRNKMDIGKNKIKFTSALIQEGVETVIKYDNNPAEVTIYLVNGESVGGFMRSNPLKDAEGNLNSRGMLYQKYCISEIRQFSEHKVKEAVYSVIARLATLASGYEIEEVVSGESL